MKFRYARHTHNLERLVDFYESIIGLDKLGGFADHNGYDGVFLGIEGQDWHIEFTKSHNKPNHHPDKDDLIVLSLDNDQQLNEIINRAKQADITPVISSNPYWNDKGIELTDPDGFGVMLTTLQFG